MVNQSECPSCESKDTSVRIEKSEFTYLEREDPDDNIFLAGVKVREVKIPVTIPVRTCSACDLEWTDHHGEKRRGEALARHRASKKSPSS